MCHHIWFEDIFIWLSSFVPQTHAEVKKVGIPAPSGKTGWYSLGARGRRDTRHSPPPQQHRLSEVGPVWACTDPRCQKEGQVLVLEPRYLQSLGSHRKEGTLVARPVLQIAVDSSGSTGSHKPGYCTCLSPPQLLRRLKQGYHSSRSA